MGRFGSCSDVTRACWRVAGIALVLVACSSPAEQDATNEGIDVPPAGEVADLSSVEPSDVPPGFDTDATADLPLPDTHAADAPVADGGDGGSDDEGLSNDGSDASEPNLDVGAEEVHPEVPCQSADECPPDEGCVIGLCGACANDGECRDGEECHQGVCRNLACLTDAECVFPGLRLVCIDHHCEPCQSTYDCLESAAYGGGFQCLGGECSDANCVDDADCPADLPVCGGNGLCRLCQNGSDECGEGFVCAEGTCEPGDCWIEGQVWPAGATKPGNGCAVCLATLRLAWSPNVGVECNDEQACTYDDRCHAEVAGVCSGTAYQCTPAPEIAACAQGVCHGTGPTDCTLEKKSSWDGCLVDGACFLATDANPANPCEVCNGSTGTWMSRELGAACGSGKCRACQVEGERVVCRFVPAGLDPRNQCTAPCEVCDGQGECRWVATSTDPHLDPDNDCPEQPMGSCGTNGACKGGSDACAWWADGASVSDGNECTFNDRCDGMGGKTGDPVVDGTPCWAHTKVCRQGKCGDCLHNDECSGGRVCSNGSCVVGSCTTADQCGTPPACYRNKCKDFMCGLEPDDAVACTDGDPCTQNDYCLAGTCHGGLARDCSPLDSACLQGTCDPADGQCHALPREDGTACTDGDPCTNESCQAGACTATPKCLDDGLWCTNDCVNGGCIYARLESACLIDGVCRYHGELKPAEPCFECIATGEGARPNDWSFDTGNACSDDIACTIDVCQAGACVSTASDAFCDDGDVRIFQGCEPSAGGCVEKGWAYVIGPDVTPVDAVAIDGGVVVTGSFLGTVDFDPGPGVDLQVSGANEAVFLTRLNPDGSYRWTKTWKPGTGGTIEAGALALTSQGEIVLAGSFTDTADFDPSAASFLLSTTDGSQGGFILRLTAEGAFLHAFPIGGSQYDSVTLTHLEIDAADNLFFAGPFSGTLTFDAAHKLTGIKYELNSFVARITLPGVCQWASGLLGGDANKAAVIRSLAVAPGGGVVLGGWFRNGTDFDPGPGVVTASAAYNSGFVLSLSDVGGFAWLRTFKVTDKTAQGLAYASVASVLPRDDGGVLAAGYYGGEIELDPGNAGIFTSAQNHSESYLVALNDKGQIVASNGAGVPGTSASTLLDVGGALKLLAVADEHGDYGLLVNSIDSYLTVTNRQDVLTNGAATTDVSGLMVNLDGTLGVVGTQRGFDLDPTSLVFKPAGDVLYVLKTAIPAAP